MGFVSGVLTILVHVYVRLQFFEGLTFRYPPPPKLNCNDINMERPLHCTKY